jgi:sulfite reductase beta subunit-like hemoprotein
MAGKLNIEEVKQKKDGLDVLADFSRYAETGFQTIDPEDFVRFRWYGVYQQRPNEGHFMMRLRIPNGDLTAEQTRKCAQLAIDHGRNLIDITTRQTFQYHWLTIQSIPVIFDELAKVGIVSTGACGDIARNFVGCPVAGIDAEEIIDASEPLVAASKRLIRDKEFSNLPRKYKISVSGCRIHCGQPDINCVGVFGAEMKVNGVAERGFGVKVGGGLSTRPYFGEDLGVFISPDEVEEVLVAITKVYRDAPELRQDRTRSRLKFLIHDPKIGIGIDGFKKRFLEAMGRNVREGGPFEIPRNTEHTDHLGIHRQKQHGLWYVGIGIRAGRNTGEDMLRFADLAEEFSGNKRIRLTRKQNLILTDIPDSKLGALKAKLDEYGFDYKPSVFKRALVSCTGIEFCNLAVTETKELARRVSLELEEKFPGAEKTVRIHFSGCPNNCGQNAIADIGLRGGKTKVDGQMVDAFDILVGGTTGANRAFGEVASKKVPATHLTEHIGRLYEHFTKWCHNGETFREYVDAHSLEQIDAVGRGLPVPEKPPATE